MSMSEEEKEALTKKAYQEVIAIMQHEFSNFKDYLASTYMSKTECGNSHKYSDDRHNGLNTKFYICLGISIFAVFIAGWAVGMKITEAIMMVR